MSAARPGAGEWTTPADISGQLRRMWDDGRLLAARFRCAALFPLELRLRQPGAAAMGEQFDTVRQWIRTLEGGSRGTRGYGYEIVWREINHRQLGRNRVPAAVLVPTADDALRLIGRLADARRFDQLAADTVARFPDLTAWVARRPMTVLEQDAAWSRILAILSWFLVHPRPGLYLRQLDIEGVDSKFIEARKGLLSELLDQVLPAQAVVPDFAGARQFEARYGLLSKPALLRCRLLDPRLHIAGMSDITVPVAQFARGSFDVERVFITENEVNGLAFPEARAAMVIFGGGYGIDRLAQVEWLQGKDVVYWGDIDTHGFAILDRLRTHLPHARSMLMDATTLHAHRPLWGQEEGDKRFTGQVARLTESELQLFIELRDNVHGERVRMEQERLRFSAVSAAVARFSARNVTGR